MTLNDNRLLDIYKIFELSVLSGDNTTEIIYLWKVSHFYLQHMMEVMYGVCVGYRGHPDLRNYLSITIVCTPNSHKKYYTMIHSLKG